MTPSDPRYRWVVLAVGVLAQASVAGVLQGLPGLAPVLRADYDLSLTGLGVLLGSVTAGLVATLALWGAAADRFGERRVMTGGLLLTVLALVGAARTTTYVPLLVCLVVAGAAGASVNAASGRAVLGWFGPEQRGLAMGVRQTALPLGAGLAAAVLPPLADRQGLDAAFLLLAAGCAVSAVAVVAWVREAPGQSPRIEESRSPLADPALRRLGAVSALLVVPQFAVVAFLVVYLTEEQGVSVGAAALVLAAVQLGGGLSRVAAGRWADRMGLRVVPLRRLATAVVVLFAALAGAALQGGRVVVPLLVLAGVVAISWNGLAFTAVGERAAPGRAGAALGVQNTAVALGAAATPPLLGALVERTDWPVGYAAAGVAAVLAVVLLRPLAREERAAA